MNAKGEGNQHGTPRPTTPADLDLGETDAEGSGTADALIQPSLPMPSQDDQPPGY